MQPYFFLQRHCNDYSDCHLPQQICCEQSDFRHESGAMGELVPMQDMKVLCSPVQILDGVEHLALVVLPVSGSRGIRH